MCNYQPELTLEQSHQLQDLTQRREAGEPIAYLINKKEFYGREFYVNQNTLIPRPESEQFIELAKRLFKNKPPHNIIDVGTGSGALGVTLKKEFPDSETTLIDISKDALKVALKNSQNLQAKVQIKENNLLEGYSEMHIDLIVANLPYIGTKDHNHVDPNTDKYEPSISLYSGEDGLDHYRELFHQIQNQSITFTHLLCEFGFGQSKDIQLISSQTFKDYQIQVHDDLAGIPRILQITSTK